MFRVFIIGFLTGLALHLCSSQQAKDAKFSCDGRSSGYYADVSSGCQVYHMCDGLGRQFSYTCPNATLFQQRMLICDHWYMVNCSRAEDDYSANLLIGQQKPFVEDTGSNPFQRTPRPDLLSHPSSESEYNIIYRNRNENSNNRKNIVGVTRDNEASSEDQPTYFPPSHWSTAYPTDTSTAKPTRNGSSNRRILNQGNKVDYPSGKKLKAKPKAIDFASSNRNGNNFENSQKYKNFDSKYNTAPTLAPVNYKSNFKATTPVFPLKVEDTSEPANDVGVLPPSLKTAETKPKVNYRSSYRATTPVFPLTVEDSSAAPNDIGILPPIGSQSSKQPAVSFESNFKATTPVYPLTVDITSDAPNDLGILPPISSQPKVNFASTFKATTPVFPLTVEDSSEAPSEAGILPPSRENAPPQVNYKSNFKATTPVFPVTGDDSSVAPSDLGILPPEDGQVSFKSDFKATTPVYPTFLPSDIEVSNVPLQKETHVNFNSDFKATTPVYPKFVEATSADPGEVGVLAPQLNRTEDVAVPDILLSLAPPEFDADYEKTHEKVETTPAEPSVFYQAPKFEPDYTAPEVNVNIKNGIEIENIMRSLSKQQWQNIRERLHIPEYDFPLDDATRPSYDSVFNSFGSKPSPKR